MAEHSRSTPSRCPSQRRIYCLCTQLHLLHIRQQEHFRHGLVPRQPRHSVGSEILAIHKKHCQRLHLHLTRFPRNKNCIHRLPRVSKNLLRTSCHSTRVQLQLHHPATDDRRRFSVCTYDQYIQLHGRGCATYGRNRCIRLYS